MDLKFTHFLLLFAIIVVQSTVLIAFSEIEDNNGKPKADKLTISIDQRLPPQIAYYIPDSAFNRSFSFDFNRNMPQPPLINKWPSNDRRNGTFIKSNMTDLMMSQRRQYRYTAVQPKDEMRTFVEKDPHTAYQNFNYQIDFAKIPDKEPDFKRFESLNRERETVKKVKPKKKKYIKRPVSTNHANTSPNIRNRIKYIKIDHANKFEASKEKHQSGDSGNGFYIDELENHTIDGLKVYNNGAKLKKTRRKKPHYSKNKLSHLASSIENESNFNYDSVVNSDEIDQYHSKYSSHNDCDHENADLMLLPESDNENENTNFDNSRNMITNKRPKGFSIYLTKVIKHPKPYRSLRMDKSNSLRKDFIPTHIMSSVRGVTKILHKPRKVHRPTLRERLRESGAHLVYSEDGYEDKDYDHSVEDKSLEYRSRTRRSTDLKDLKGQELIDHLDNLIKNVTDYLNSSEIIPELNKRFPLYNSTNSNIKDSPIEYSEHAKPVIDEVFSSELYESKSIDCDEGYDLPNPNNTTDGPKKRLKNMGNKINCLKKKLFGKNPLDNPIFHEDNVSQPKPHRIYSNAMQEAESIQTVSEIVHSDVMDNIKYNFFNENQRIFSDFGVSDNFAVGTFNTHPVTVKPSNELNTNEKYLNDRNKPKEKFPSVGQNVLPGFNPFKDPAQLPLLDISKYIPTPKYSSTETDNDIARQTDFVPIVSPYSYASNYNKKPTSILTSTSTTTTTTTTNAPVTQFHSKYGPFRGPGPIPQRKVPHFNRQQTKYRTQVQNVLLFKNRRPVAIVRFAPKKILGARA